jgi:hypothetical protein
VVGVTNGVARQWACTIMPTASPLCVHSKKNGICVRLATATGLSATDKGIDHDGQHQHDTFDDQLYGGWLIE